MIKTAVAIVVASLLFLIFYIITTIDNNPYFPACEHRNSVIIESGIAKPFISIVDYSAQYGNIVKGFPVKICQDCGVIYCEVDSLRPYTMQELIDR